MPHCVCGVASLIHLGLSTSDLEWYLRQQLHPPVARLCEPIAGTDAAQLAQCLGLDPSKFAHGSGGGADGLGGDRPRTLTSQMTDAQRFADVAPLKLMCHACSVRTPATGLFHKSTVRVCARWCCCSLTWRLHMHVLTGVSTWGRRMQGTTVVLVCPNPSCQLPMPAASVATQVNTAIRDDVQRYYDGWLVRVPVPRSVLVHSLTDEAHA